MFNLTFFDGKLSRNRNQEAMFNSLNERDIWMQQMEAERVARAHDTRKQNAAKTIQRFYRNQHGRQECAKDIRRRFDEVVKTQGYDPKILVGQAHRLNVFYRFGAPGDPKRLDALAGSLGRAAEEHGIGFLPEGTRLLLSLKIVQYTCLEDLKNLRALPVSSLRFMEWFCSKKDLSYLTQRGWYEGAIRLIQASLPENGLHGVQNSLPPRVDALHQDLIAPVEKQDSDQFQEHMKHMVSVLLNHDDVHLMFAACLPFVARQIQQVSLSSLLSILPTIEVSTKNAALLRCHLLVILLSPAKDLPLSDALPTLRCLSACIPDWIINEKSALEKIDNEMLEHLRLFIHGSRFAQLFTEAVNCASTEADLEAITRFGSIGPANLLHVMSSTSLFMERLYSFVTTMKTVQISAFSRKTTEILYVKELCQGHSLENKQRTEFIPSLVLLSKLVCAFVESTFDEDFAEGGRVVDALTTIVSSTRLIRDLALGLIDLAFPDNFWTSNLPTEQRKADEEVWSAVYDQLVKTLQTVHRKNNRVKFLPDGFWTDHGRQIVISRASYAPRSRTYGDVASYQPFSFIEYLAEEDKMVSQDSDSDSDAEMTYDEHKKKPTTSDLRNISIIRSVPFLLLFDKRLKIFQDLMENQRFKYGGGERFGHRGYGVSVTVRRQHLYEDSFVSLSPGEAPNLRAPIRVRMVNWAGADEQGVDGGGIFREFLSELLKAGLDPERGLFTYTHDGLLYPNPIASAVYSDSYSQHYHFLGRMLAKLIFEGMMLDVRFADFFLVQLLGFRITNIDLEQMKSYDPNVYKHLRDLLSYSEEELSQLGLDFSVLIDTVGQLDMIELKRGGKDIPVTRANLREYIQLYVNYHLKQRISPMVDAMRAGVSDVIEPVWLGMFDPAEMQVIVSGVDADIDVEDMKKNTVVYPCEGVDSKRYMRWFWTVVGQMSNQDKAALLKFITGCPRPPIAGFRSLSPNIAVQLHYNNELLPTSATCMNLLKLPVYDSTETLKAKISYAIHAGAGFELA